MANFGGTHQHHHHHAILPSYAYSLLLSLIAILPLFLVVFDRAYTRQREYARDDVVNRLVEEISELRRLHHDGGMVAMMDVVGGGGGGGGGGEDDEGRVESSSGARRLRSTTTTTPIIPGRQRGMQTLAIDFGVVGDGITNDGPAIQSAIDMASSSSSGGGIVQLPPGIFRTYSSLLIPGGISLVGTGYGSSPLSLQYDAGGSTIAYCGTDYAVKVNGHGSSLRNLAVYNWRYGNDCVNVSSSGGILVDANSRLIESVYMSNVLIYSFLNGSGLELRSTNGGGIAYGNYQNLRIRHAKTGIRLVADEGSFVNTNSFLGGAISGGGFEYGIHAEGPGSCNDNKFYGTCIEPPDTDVSHVYVTGSRTNVRLHDVRLEATAKSLDRPIVIIDDSSYGNVMDGMLGHTHVMANLNRNPGMDLSSLKSVGLDPAPANVYWNAAFKGYGGPGAVMPGWTLVGGSNATLTIMADAEMLYPDHHVISIDYLGNAGGALKLQADQTIRVPGHDYATLGIHVRTTVKGSIVAAMRHASGSIVSSSSHSGSGKWEFVGMTGLYDRANPTFYFSISDDVEVTAPTLTYGHASAMPGASFMSSSGAKMSGTLSYGVSTLLPPPSDSPNPTYWKLPRNMGNVYVVDVLGNPSRTIARLNELTADRFPRGAVVTLMFSLAGTTIANGPYIKMKRGTSFVSVVNSSITLMADGVGTWTEVSRNV